MLLHVRKLKPISLVVDEGNLIYRNLFNQNTRVWMINPLTNGIIQNLSYLSEVLFASGDFQTNASSYTLQNFSVNGWGNDKESIEENLTNFVYSNLGLWSFETNDVNLVMSVGTTHVMAFVYSGSDPAGEIFGGGDPLGTSVVWQESLNVYSQLYDFEEDGGLTTNNDEVSYTPYSYYFDPAAFQKSVNDINLESNFEVVFEFNPLFSMTGYGYALGISPASNEMIGLSWWANTTYYHINFRSALPIIDLDLYYEESITWPALNLNAILSSQTDKSFILRKVGNLVEFFIGATSIFSSILTNPPVGNAKVIVIGNGPTYFKGFSRVYFTQL